MVGNVRRFKGKKEANKEGKFVNAESRGGEGEKGRRDEKRKQEEERGKSEKGRSSN